MSTPKQNSVEQLSELYNVVIGIALSVSIYNSIDANNSPVPLHLGQLANLATFFVLIVPFYHGAVRHLFATYVEDGGSSRIKNGALLADFFLLFIEGCLFVTMSALLADSVKFAWVLVCLLLLDTIWGFLAHLAFTGAQSQQAERKWVYINLVTAGIIIVILIFAGDVFVVTPVLSQLGIFAVISLRTVVDYSLCWKFYFPDS